MFRRRTPGPVKGTLAGWGQRKSGSHQRTTDVQFIEELDKLDKVEDYRLAEPKGLEGEIWVEEVEGD